MHNNPTDAAPLHQPDSDGYPDFLASIRTYYDHMTGDASPLYVVKTNAAPASLFDFFLDMLPAESRQGYNCNACRRFVNRFGALVTIDAHGLVSSALWGSKVPPLFATAVGFMRDAVEAGEVAGVFLTKETAWGVESNEVDSGDKKVPNKVWRHMSLTPKPAHVYRHAVLSADQAMAEKAEDFKMLSRALAEFTIEQAGAAHTLLTVGGFYRSEKCIGVAKWFLDLHTARQGAKRSSRDNLVWRAVATAPTGYPHVRSGMIGTLLEDIASGMDVASIKRRFDEKMSPANYQRAVAAPSAGNIAQAEKFVSTLALAGSLSRRYATAEDLQHLWRPRLPKGATAVGVFGHLTPKAPAVPPALVLPQQTMTWEKFQRTVLPNALRIEAQVPASSDRFAALVTAANPEAPPILQWDRAESRNPVSWYYAAGIDAEIKRRVLGAGGMHENVDIRASLIWNNRNDLDLHVVTPYREHIFFSNKRSSCGGWLDVDMNVQGETDTPVENIRWAKHTARAGRYQVYVQNYRFHEHSYAPTPFRVELEVNGEVFHFDGIASPRRETNEASNVMVTAFTYQPGVKLAEKPTNLRQANGANGWNVAPGSWVKVNGVVESPNLWSERPMLQHGKHVFFLLDGCKDTAQGVGRGFFTETLISDLRPYRSTLEAYAASAEIAEPDGDPACGLGMTDQAPWDLLLRVATVDGASVIYKIDRWD